MNLKAITMALFLTVVITTSLHAQQRGQRGGQRGAQTPHAHRADRSHGLLGVRCHRGLGVSMVTPPKGIRRSRQHTDERGGRASPTRGSWRKDEAAGANNANHTARRHHASSRPPAHHLGRRQQSSHQDPRLERRLAVSFRLSQGCRRERTWQGYSVAR